MFNYSVEKLRIGLGNTGLMCALLVDKLLFVHNTFFSKVDFSSTKHTSHPHTFPTLFSGFNSLKNHLSSLSTKPIIITTLYT